jgi:hypothetical protein
LTCVKYIYSNLIMLIMLRRSNDKRARWMRFVGHACLLGIFFSFAYLPIESGLSVGSYSAAVVVQKDVRIPFVVKAGLPLNFSPEGWIDERGLSFLRVDRKQNLRLWPVVASGLTRSPPLA